MAACQRLLLLVLTSLAVLAPSANAQLVCSNVSDIVFLVDNNSTVANWEQVRQFIIGVVNGFDISSSKTQVGVVTAGNSFVTSIQLNQYSSQSALTAAVGSNATFPPGLDYYFDLTTGLQQVCTNVFTTAQGARTNANHILIVISDSNPNVNPTMTLTAAQNCWSLGVQVYTIGVMAADRNLQLAWSSPPQQESQNFWYITDISDLQASVSSVQRAVCFPSKLTGKPCQTLDLAFVMPMPYNRDDLRRLLGYINQYITAFLVTGSNNVSVGVMTYTGTQTTVQIRLGDYTDESSLKTAISNIPYSYQYSADATNALNMINQTVLPPSVLRPDVQTVVVFFVETPNSDSNREATAANLLHNYGTDMHVIAVGVSSYVQLTELAVISTSTRDQIPAVSYTDLYNYFNALDDSMCMTDNSQCAGIADIVLILDTSTSIAASGPGFYDNWNSILAFAQTVVNAFPIGPDLTRIGVIQFSDRIQPAFYLNTFQNKSQVIDAIAKLELFGGDTDIAGALRVTRDTMFSTSNGARTLDPNGIQIPHIAILLTDGKATRGSDQTWNQANQTKNAGIIIYAIGVTDQVDENQLKAICSQPYYEYFFYASYYNQLNTVLQSIIKNSCKKVITLPTTTPTTTTRRTTTTTTPTTTPTTTTTTTLTTTTTTSTTMTPTTTTTTPTTTTTTPKKKKVPTATLR